MTDTMKISRPKFPRGKQGPGGRVEHDWRGNAVWTRTRADDSADAPDTSALSLEDTAILNKEGRLGRKAAQTVKKPGPTTDAKKKR